MATRHATGRLRRPSAMQLNHIGIAEGPNIRPVRYLPTDLCAIGSSGWTRNARTVVPAHAARAPHCGRSGAGFGSILRVEVIKLYQGLVRYELSLRPTLRSYNCGVCRPTAYGAREIRRFG